MKYTKAIIILIIVIVYSSLMSACAAVHSDELKTTLAEDLEIHATLYEYTDDDETEIAAQMQTEDSDVGIEFTQGETLTVNADAEEGLAGVVYLSNLEILNLAQDYEGEVDRTIEGGNYYLTYTDKDDNETTATIPSFSVPEITNMENGDVLSGDEFDVEWEDAEITGTLSLRVSYSGSGYSGIKTRSIDNTGSYSFDCDTCRGSGTVNLMHLRSINYMEGFAEASISMYNVSRRYVSFTTGQASLVQADALEEVLSVDELVQQCQTECREGDEDIIIVDDVTYDCCM
ncbi:MAG: hypothetical protein ABII18_07620 [bacterium]|nr:hypothetical protein [bacterium]